MNADLIVSNIGQLVTCASGAGPKRWDAMKDVGLMEGAAVAIANGTFSGVGPSSEILREFASDNIVDADGGVACPAFVDPHTHVVFAGDRLNEFELKIKGADYLEILANGGGIISTVQQTRAAVFSDLVDKSRRRIDKMIGCGTTTI